MPPKFRLDDYSYEDYESITVGNTAVGFTAGKIAPSGNVNPVKAFCRLETAQVRFRMDGTDPTSSEGILLEVGETLEITGEKNLRNFRAIRTGSTSGVLKVHYGY